MRVLLSAAVLALLGLSFSGACLMLAALGIYRAPFAAFQAGLCAIVFSFIVALWRLLFFVVADYRKRT